MKLANLYQLIGLFLFCAAVNCNSQPAVSSISVQISSGSSPSYVVGWEFYVDRPIEIGELGFYGQISGEVCLWDESGTKLASCYVSTNDSVVDNFEYHPIPLIQLLPGQHYTVACLYTNGGVWISAANSATFAQGVFFVARHFAWSSSLSAPPTGDYPFLPGGASPIGGFGASFKIVGRPIITTQPVSQTNIVGSTVNFQINADSPQPMSFQWQKNGTNLVDGGNLFGIATNTLTITNVSDTDAANYSVIVSNTHGSVASSIATLTVTYPPVFTVQPTNMLVLMGNNVTFGASLTGSASYSHYQWRLNGTNILNATNGSYAIATVGTNHAGIYSLEVTNAAGSATSSNAALTVVVSPKSQTNYASSTATFSAPAFSPYPVNFQWQKNGTNLIDGGNISGTATNTLTITTVAAADAATYNLVVSNSTGSVTTSNATLSVNAARFFFIHPTSQSVGIGSNVTFNATAYGEPPLVLQWYFNNFPVGSPVADTNVTSYTLTNVQTNQAGNYSVKVFNGSGNSASSNAMLTVVVYPPVITGQPVGQKPMLGQSASFTVSVNGTAPFQYRWRLNGTNILNATNAIYAIASVATNHNGNYSVAVTNSAGGVISSNAVLKVIVPPTVALQILAGYPFLGLNGMLSSNFVVQYNTNLSATNWLQLLSITNLSVNPYQFLDPAGNVQPARFYRALMQ